MKASVIGIYFLFLLMGNALAEGDVKIPFRVITANLIDEASGSLYDINPIVVKNLLIGKGVDSSKILGISCIKGELCVVVVDKIDFPGGSSAVKVLDVLEGYSNGRFRIVNFRAHLIPDLLRP
jgi:hypothetical protein